MKKKFKHKKLVIVLVIIVAAIIVLVGVAKRKLNSVAEATKIVQLEKVDKRDLSDFISLTGTVSGETKINYSSTAATEIKTVNVQVGDVVKEGDVIATLDKDSIQKQIDVLEKSLSNAAALKQNETNQNQRTLERAKEDQKNQLAQANDSDTQTQLDQLRKQLDDCTITSKSAGIVTAVNVSVGDVNTANATLVTVENNTDMIVNASVTEKDILKLQEGMKAIITSDALDDQEINGEIIKVVKVYNASQPTTEQTGKETSGAANTGGFSVQIKLDPCDLISGMSAKAKIVLTDRENVLSVPYDLVQQDEDGKSYVLCAEENKDGTYTAVKKNITVGDEINYYTEVTGGDLKAGDYIIMDYAISEGDTFQGERGSDVSETEDGGSTSVSSEVTAD